MWVLNAVIPVNFLVVPSTKLKTYTQATIVSVIITITITIIIIIIIIIEARWQLKCHRQQMRRITWVVQAIWTRPLQGGSIGLATLVYSGSVSELRPHSICTASEAAFYLASFPGWWATHTEVQEALYKETAKEKWFHWWMQWKGIKVD